MDHPQEQPGGEHPDKRTRTAAAIVLICFGAAALGAAILADSLGLSEPGIGPKQIASFAAGIALVLVGNWVLSGPSLSLKALSGGVRLRLIANAPLLLIAAGWVGVQWLEQTQDSASTTKPAKPAQGQHSKDYDALLARNERNSNLLNPLMISQWLEQAERNRISAGTTETPTADAGQDADAINSQFDLLLEAQRARERERLNLAAFDMSAPFNIQSYPTVEVPFQGSGYTIEVMVWDAAPGIRMPAVVYKPMHPLENKLPVVLTPPGCGEHVASNDETHSMQRRMANLALSGFIVFSTDGFCHNGPEGKVLGNDNSYRAYGVVSGSGVIDSTLETVTWLRALDYLATRTDTDMSRVGMTGYSNGAAIIKGVLSVTDKISAVAFGPTNVGRPPDEDIYFQSRAGSIDRQPWAFFNGYEAFPKYYDYAYSEDALAASQALDERWTAFSKNMALTYQAPAPTLFVLAASDDHYSLLEAEAALKQMQKPWVALGADTTPEMQVVAGPHSYPPEAQAIIVPWLVEKLHARPSLPYPTDALQHETPIQPTESLQPIAVTFAAGSLQALLSQYATAYIAKHRETFSIQKMSKSDARARLAWWLGLDQALDHTPGRSIVIDDTAIPLWKMSVRYQYRLVPVDASVTAGLFILDPQQKTQTPAQVDLYVTSDGLPPRETALHKELQEGHVVAVLLLPGYGPSASSQGTIGNTATDLADHLTLPGMGVLSIQHTVDILSGNWQGASIHLVSEGVEASNISYYAIALDERIASLSANDAMTSFGAIFHNYRTPPPSVVMPGFLSEFEVADLQWMAQPRTIEIVSESKLCDFVPKRERKLVTDCK